MSLRLYFCVFAALIGVYVQPVNHKLLAERFSEAVDEAYKDTWREFFHDQDGINDIAQLQSPKPQQQLLQQQQQQAASQQTEAEEHVSALEVS